MGNTNTTARVAGNLTAGGGGGGGGGGGSPSGPANAIQLNSDPAGSFSGSNLLLFDNSGSSVQLIIGNSLEQGVITFIDANGDPFQLAPPLVPAGGPSGFRFPSLSMIPNQLLITDGNGNSMYVDPSTWGVPYFDPTGAAAAAGSAAQSNAESYADTKASAAQSNAESYTDTQIAALDFGPPSVGTSRIVDVADGSGGWLASPISIDSSGVIQNVSDITGLPVLGPGAGLNSTLAGMMAAIASIQSILAPGVSGAGTNVTSTSGIVTLILP